MTAVRLAPAVFAILLAAAPRPAAAQDTPDVWSSGYQMGAFWAAVSSRNGDVLSLSCGEGGGPNTPKGASVRVVLASIKGQAATRQPIEAQFAVDGLSVTLAMTASAGELTLAGGADARAVARLAAALRTASAASVAIEGAATPFALKGANEALEGVAGCAAAQTKP